MNKVGNIPVSVNTNGNEEEREIRSCYSKLNLNNTSINEHYLILPMVNMKVRTTTVINDIPIFNFANYTNDITNPKLKAKSYNSI